MRTHLTAPRILAAAFLAALCGSPADAASPLAGSSVSGIAKGILGMPEPQYTTGSAQANLLPFGAGPNFSFQAQLTEIVSPCMSCREGDIQGTLDDGVGTGPDYLVQGHWTANQVSGIGSFDSFIFKPTGPFTFPVGRLECGFYDPYPGPGTLSGNWTLRR